MAIDTNFVATGASTPGFQTAGGFDIGADISGNSLGIQGKCSGGNGVHGQSGSSTDSGVWGENTGGGFGVAGSSVNGEGVLGSGATNGVHGKSGSPTGSGVWGENTGGGFGVSGSTNSVAPEAAVWGHNYGDGYGVRGDSDTGTGVYGSSGSPINSGVWGTNTAIANDAAGVTGTSLNGYGGQFKGAFAQLYLIPDANTGQPTSGNHQRGEFYVDSNGSLFYCNTDGVPGNWVKLA